MFPELFAAGFFGPVAGPIAGIVGGALFVTVVAVVAIRGVRADRRAAKEGKADAEAAEAASLAFWATKPKNAAREQGRVAPGTPTGGQFAAHDRSDSDVNLD